MSVRGYISTTFRNMTTSTLPLQISILVGLLYTNLDVEVLVSVFGQLYLTNLSYPPQTSCGKNIRLFAQSLVCALCNSMIRTVHIVID